MHSRLCETSELLIKENTNAMHCVAKLSKTSKIKLKFDKCHNSEKDGLICYLFLICYSQGLQFLIKSVTNSLDYFGSI